MWILIEAFALAGLLAALKYLGLMFGLAIGVPFFFAVTLPNIASRLGKSRLVAKAFKNPAYKDHKCPHCTVGVQSLNGFRGWGKIPVSIRIAQKGSLIFHPRQANVRNCPHCQGKGFRPVRTPGVVAGYVEQKWPTEDGLPLSAEPFNKEEK